MNTNDLFSIDDINSEPIYFLDEECTKPYTGHLEEYFQGKLSFEADVADGFLDGICKKYHDYTGEIEDISTMKHNMSTGFGISFYRNGNISAIGTSFQNYPVEYITLDENGGIEEEKNWKSDEIKPAFNNDQMRQIHELCQKYDLKEIHKEIIREGKNFQYAKYFE